MAGSYPLSPGQALSQYLLACDEALDWYAHGKVSWTEMLDLQEQATARLHGHLLDRFLVRAHARQSLTNRPAPASCGERA